MPGRNRRHKARGNKQKARSEDGDHFRREQFRLLLQRRQRQAAKPNRPDDNNLPESSPVCGICFDVDNKALERLKCGHVFCADCLVRQLETKWPGPRISFAFLHCAACRTPLELEERQITIFSRLPPFRWNKRETPRSKIEHLIREGAEVREKCYEVCLKRAILDGTIRNLEKMKRKSKKQEVVEKQMVAYNCFRCNKPFCGGKAECVAGQENFDMKRIICDTCSFSFNVKGYKCMVPGHGVESAVFKCDCCCNVATFDCSGSHLCDDCHSKLDGKESKRHKCRGRPWENCPLGMPHGPNLPRTCNQVPGFIIGCLKCQGVYKAVKRDYYVSARTKERNPWLEPENIKAKFVAAIGPSCGPSALTTHTFYLWFAAIIVGAGAWYANSG